MCENILKNIAGRITETTQRLKDKFAKKHFVEFIVSDCSEHERSEKTISTEINEKI